MAQEIDRHIRLLEKQAISNSEFFNSMLESLAKLPSAEQQVVLEALAGHGNERVRNEVMTVQAFVRNQALSRDFEHIRQYSPLRPGVRLELLGSPEVYTADNRPEWLNGRECRRATFIRFERLDENLAPVALIELDEAIDIPGHQGRYGVLAARYGCDFPAWAFPEGSVALCIVEAPPNDLKGFFDSHPFTERHAYYRVE
jgi:hypothetical protein